MSTFVRLTQVYNNSKEIVFDNTSKFILFSDCHRGDNSFADDFSKNRAIYLTALDYYYNGGFTYIEAGDGDELWENSRFSRVRKANFEVFSLIKKFYNDNRFYMLSGNHDMIKKCPAFFKCVYCGDKGSASNQSEPLFDNLKIHEGLILRYKETGSKIFIVHGHQGDLFNDYLWTFSCFLTRYIWRKLESLGVKNLISPAKYNPGKGVVERKIIHWIKFNKKAVIAGHTHRPMFPNSYKLPYFNAGSCVSATGITGIEISNGEIILVRWYKNAMNSAHINKKVIGGPAKISTIFT